MGKHIVTNTAKGPRGIHTVDGLVTLRAGESTGEAVEISDAEKKSAESTGNFEFGAKAAKESFKDEPEAKG